MIAVLFAAVLAGVAGAWHLDVDLTRTTLAGLLDRAASWRESGFAWPIAVGAFVLAGLVAFPVNLLIAASVVVFGPLAGAACALAGVLASAGVLHQLGRWMPASWSTRLEHPRIERVRRRVVEHGVLAIAAVRLVPVAPYSVVSLVAGIARVPRVEYFVGTAIGMLPGIVLYAVFAERARAVIADPHPRTWLALLAAVLSAILLARLLARWRRRRDAACP